LLFRLDRFEIPLFILTSPALLQVDFLILHRPFNSILQGIASHRFGFELDTLANSPPGLVSGLAGTPQTASSRSRTCHEPGFFYNQPELTNYFLPCQHWILRGEYSIDGFTILPPSPQGYGCASEDSLWQLLLRVGVAAEKPLGLPPFPPSYSLEVVATIAKL